MHTTPIAKVIRIKSCHLREISKAHDLQDALSVLNKKNFIKFDQELIEIILTTIIIQITN